MIDELYAESAHEAGLRDSETGDPLSATDILMLVIAKDPEKKPAQTDDRFRLEICRDLVGNTICADLLDYLHRDWLHVGKRKEFDKRIFDYMEIRSRADTAAPDSRLVINLRGGTKVRTDAITAILDLLESRYQLFEIALFHRAKLCAAAMLERAISEIADSYPGGTETLLTELPLKLLDSSDDEMPKLLIELISNVRQTVGKKGAVNRLDGSFRLLQKLRERRLYKEVLTGFEYTLADVALSVQERFSGPRSELDKTSRARIGARNRLQALRLLENDFGLKPCSLVMYCPPREMSTKIAEVQVFIHGDVHELDRFETEHADRGVTGGHLRAQKERFRRLWRILFAIDPSTREKLDSLNLYQSLGRAIELCVLRIQPAVGTLDEAIYSLAKELTAIEGSPLFGKSVLQRTAARSETQLAYPGGAQSLLSCVE